jgi:hypothetical protein
VTLNDQHVGPLPSIDDRLAGRAHVFSSTISRLQARIAGAVAISIKEIFSTDRDVILTRFLLTHAVPQSAWPKNQS